MNLRTLKRFLAIAELGSINKAAAHLNVSQPSLTKDLQDLEEALGVELFTRNARGVSLTSFGETIYTRAKLVDAEFRKLESEARALRDVSMGEVNVGVVPGLLQNQILPKATLNLTQRARRLTVNYRFGHRSSMLGPLLRGDLDFVIVGIEDDEYADELVSSLCFPIAPPCSCAPTIRYWKPSTAPAATWPTTLAGAVGMLAVGSHAQADDARAGHALRQQRDPHRFLLFLPLDPGGERLHRPGPLRLRPPGETHRQHRGTAAPAGGEQEAAEHPHDRRRLPARHHAVDGQQGLDPGNPPPDGRPAGAGDHDRHANRGRHCSSFCSKLYIAAAGDEEASRNTR